MPSIQRPQALVGSGRREEAGGGNSPRRSAKFRCLVASTPKHRAASPLLFQGIFLCPAVSGRTDRGFAHWGGDHGHRYRSLCRDGTGSADRDCNGTGQIRAVVSAQGRLFATLAASSTCGRSRRPRSIWKACHTRSRLISSDRRAGEVRDSVDRASRDCLLYGYFSTPCR